MSFFKGGMANMKEHFVVGKSITGKCTLIPTLLSYKPLYTSS